MYKKILKTLAFVISLSLAATPVSANLITDTVFIGDKEWAQVDLFTNLSWNDMDGVCPRGVCGSGTLNNFDMAGWTWASAAMVGDLLFKPNSVHTGGIYNTGWVTGNEVAKILTATGMRATRDDSVFTILNGSTSTDDSLFKGNARLFYAARQGRSVIYTDQNEFDNGLYGDAQTGMWLFRSVEVPEPSTLAIFALGMIGLASRRFMKQS